MNFAVYHNQGTRTKKPQKKRKFVRRVQVKCDGGCTFLALAARCRTDLGAVFFITGSQV